MIILQYSFIYGCTRWIIPLPKLKAYVQITYLIRDITPGKRDEEDATSWLIPVSEREAAMREDS